MPERAVREGVGGATRAMWKECAHATCIHRKWKAACAASSCLGMSVYLTPPFLLVLMRKLSLYLREIVQPPAHC